MFSIRNKFGRGDELYYFSNGSVLFHDEIIWSSYHPFAQKLQALPINVQIDSPSWFVGSRNNYTHQLVDFYPKLLFYFEYAHEFTSIPLRLIFGSKNNILQSLIGATCLTSSQQELALYLDSYEEQASHIGHWEIVRLRFNDLYLVKHLSVFNSFNLISKYLVSSHSYDDDIKYKKIAYLSRDDGRVANNNSIVSYMKKCWDAEILFSTKCRLKKKDLFSRFHLFVLLPVRIA